jgi:small subunit ribosomal protein S9
MAEDFSALASLQTGTAQAAAPVREPKKDAQGRSYATGKRKNAVARIWIKPGSGKIIVNGRELEVYFARPVLRMLINQPPWLAAACPARPARCVTASRKP